MLGPIDIFCVILNGEELHHLFEAVGPYVEYCSLNVCVGVCLPADLLIHSFSFSDCRERFGLE